MGSSPGLAGSLCQVIAVYALRLISRADTEGSTVSSFICDRWQTSGGMRQQLGHASTMHTAYSCDICSENECISTGNVCSGEGKLT